jgi:hypothetical protein
MNTDIKNAKSRTPSEQEEKTGEDGVLFHSSVLITLRLGYQY